MNIIGRKNATVPLLSFLLSFIVAWLLFPITGGFPLVAFSIFFIGLSTLAYFVRENRSGFERILYTGIVILSSFLLIRADEVLQFLTFLFIIGFGSVLLLPLARHHTLINLLLTPFFTIIGTLSGKNRYPYSFTFVIKYRKAGVIGKLLPSLLITVLFLIIAIPLLASANPLFNQLVHKTFSFFDLTILIQYFTSQERYYWVARILFLSLLAFSIPRALSLENNDEERAGLKVALTIHYLFPKVTMAIVLIIFFITQAQLYFASPEMLQTFGYTNARLTNEVFFQVTLVAFLIFILAYLDKKRQAWHTILTYVLLVEAFFLIGIAFKSVFDYSLLWGLTQKRLWGYATMTWLTGALLLFLYHYKKQRVNLLFFQRTIVYTIFVLIGINIANFDYLITHFSSAKTPNGTDYVYLAKRSPDGAYYEEAIKQLDSQLATSTTYEPQKLFAAFDLVAKIEWLKRKYGEEKNLNSFNLSEYQEYRAIKDLPTAPIRHRLQKIYEKYNPPAPASSPIAPNRSNQKNL